MSLWTQQQAVRTPACAERLSVIPVDERRRLSGQGWLGGQEQNDAESIWIVRLDPVGSLLVGAPVWHPLSGEPFFGAVDIS